jgi:hypothetical protein
MRVWLLPPAAFKNRGSIKEIKTDFVIEPIRASSQLYAVP